MEKALLSLLMNMINTQQLHLRTQKLKMIILQNTQQIAI